MKTGRAAAQEHARIRVLRAEIGFRDVWPHQRAVPRLHHHVAELVEGGEPGLGGDVDQLK